MCIALRICEYFLISKGGEEGVVHSRSIQLINDKLAYARARVVCASFKAQQRFGQCKSFAFCEQEREREREKQASTPTYHVGARAAPWGALTGSAPRVPLHGGRSTRATPRGSPQFLYYITILYKGCTEHYLKLFSIFLQKYLQQLLHNKHKPTERNARPGYRSIHM